DPWSADRRTRACAAGDGPPLNHERQRADNRAQMLLPLARRRRRAPSSNGDPRLTVRFALYAALALLAAVAATFIFARREAIARAEQNGRYHTRFVAASILRDRLRASDFTAPVAGARRAELDTLAHRE